MYEIEVFARIQYAVAEYREAVLTLAAIIQGHPLTNASLHGGSGESMSGIFDAALCEPPISLRRKLHGSEALLPHSPCGVAISGRRCSLAAMRGSDDPDFLPGRCWNHQPDALKRRRRALAFVEEA
jgi:hypothetical protein